MAMERSRHEDRLRSLGTKGIKTWDHSKSHSPGGVECQKMIKFDIQGGGGSKV